MRNGEVINLEDPIQEAQKRLVDTVMKQPADPRQVSLSAYLNGLLTSVRTDALVTFVTTTAHQDQTDTAERFHRILLDAFARYTQLVLDAQINTNRIQLAAGPLKLDG